jgi:hypothetical protein
VTKDTNTSNRFFRIDFGPDGELMLVCIESCDLEEFISKFTKANVDFEEVSEPEWWQGRNH